MLLRKLVGCFVFGSRGSKVHLRSVSDAVIAMVVKLTGFAIELWAIPLALALRVAVASNVWLALLDQDLRSSRGEGMTRTVYSTRTLARKENLDF